MKLVSLKLPQILQKSFLPTQTSSQRTEREYRMLNFISGKKSSSLVRSNYLRIEDPDTLRRKQWSYEKSHLVYEVKQLDKEDEDSHKKRCSLMREISKTFWIPDEKNEAFDKRMEVMAGITANSILKASWSRCECVM